MINHTNPYANTDALSVSETIRQLRTMISEEYAAANLYEQFAEVVTNTEIRDAVLDIADEERVHAGEFEYMIEYLQDEYDIYEESDDDLADKGEDEAEESIEGEDDAEEVFGSVDIENADMPVEQQAYAPSNDNLVYEGY